MKSKKRIVYLIHDLPFFLSHRLPLANAAVSSGYEVHVICVPAQFVEKGPLAKFTYHPVEVNKTAGFILDTASTLASLVRLYGKIRPDLAHHVTLRPVLYGGIVARICRVKCVVNALTGLGSAFTSPGLVAQVRRKVLKYVLRAALAYPRSRTIFQNPDDLRAIVRAGILPASKTALIRGSGVDPRLFCPVPEPEGVPLVVLASRMLWQKGIGEFIKAANLLRKEGLRVRFALVGDTYAANPDAIPTDELEAIRAEGIVEWWGFRKDMVEVLHQSSVVCLPTYYGEGVPKVLIEAAACGRAIVTTDWPGCREIVRNGINGLLVRPRDVDELACAMRRLITNRELRQSMGERGRAIAEQEFSERLVIENTLALYDSLLNGTDIGESGG